MPVFKLTSVKTVGGLRDLIGACLSGNLLCKCSLGARYAFIAGLSLEYERVAWCRLAACSKGNG